MQPSQTSFFKYTKWHMEIPFISPAWLWSWMHISYCHGGLALTKWTVPIHLIKQIKYSKCIGQNKCCCCWQRFTSMHIFLLEHEWVASLSSPSPTVYYHQRIPLWWHHLHTQYKSSVHPWSNTCPSLHCGSCCWSFLHTTSLHKNIKTCTLGVTWTLKTANRQYIPDYLIHPGKHFQDVDIRNPTDHNPAITVLHGLFCWYCLSRCLRYLEGMWYRESWPPTIMSSGLQPWLIQSPVSGFNPTCMTGPRSLLLTRSTLGRQSPLRPCPWASPLFNICQ